MKCEKARGFFSEYFDGQADGAEEISAHLQECPACAADYDNFRKLMDEVRTLPEPTLPAGFRDDILHDILEQKLIKQRWNRRFYGQFVIAAAACFLLAVIWLPRMLDVRSPIGEPIDETFFDPFLDSAFEEGFTWNSDFGISREDGGAIENRDMHRAFDGDIIVDIEAYAPPGEICISPAMGEFAPAHDEFWEYIEGLREARLAGEPAPITTRFELNDTVQAHENQSAFAYRIAAALIVLSVVVAANIIFVVRRRGKRKE